MKRNVALLLIVILAILNFAEASRRSGKFRKQETEVKEKLFNATGNGKGAKRPKLFSLFNVVTFSNDPCASTTSTNGVNRNGTCYTSTECADRGGSSSGNCAAGFGVCCVFILDGSGSTTVSENCTYIQNTGFPTAVTGASTQSYTVQKSASDVCFLRLDFETFSLLGTNGSDQLNEGVCTDTFTVTTSTNMFVPTICGENTGKHIYVDIGCNDGDTATLNFATTATTANRMFDIKVTQVECENESAPRDSCCLQYFTGCSGRLMSFNYDNANDNHLNNQQYSICIRQECGFCCVQYQICPDQLGTLPATVAPGAPAGWSFDTSMTTSKGDAACTGDMNSIDRIVIQASGATCAMAGGDCGRAVNSAYCGMELNQNGGVNGNIPICDCTAPFTVDVFFNQNSDQAAILGAANTRQSRGFCLDYMQVPC